MLAALPASVRSTRPRAVGEGRARVEVELDPNAVFQLERAGERLVGRDAPARGDQLEARACAVGERNVEGKRLLLAAQRQRSAQLQLTGARLCQRAVERALALSVHVEDLVRDGVLDLALVARVRSGR